MANTADAPLLKSAQEKLEQLVIETVLTYYERYHGEEGRRALSEIVLDCVEIGRASCRERV